ncbi:uncharacterized protein LOC101746935 isoform X2 [Bombyx mori]|uniref:MADF domain-containing protein n=1 Tax=Bombyx mori TaxID=7091 RepID=A0A8R2G8G2_BOMMO|nr:uncharacterized protein LOC101746935 isoform X1 [Bombyx mori]
MSKSGTKMRLSEAKTLELIDLYRREECLWNSRLSVYRYKTKRNEAIERIVKELNVRKLEAHHVTTKIKNLRNSYCAELKKMSGGRRRDSFKPKVWFAKMDSFLRAHVPCPTPDATVMPSLPNVKIEIVSDSEESESNVTENNKEDLQSLIRTIEKLSEQLKTRTTRKQDVFDDFGTYVASVLRSLPSERAMALQPKIISLINSSDDIKNEYS